jgi:hypothetical protein
VKGISPTKDGLLIRIYRNGNAISQHIAWSQYASRELAEAAAERILADLEKRHPVQSKPGRQPSVGYTHTRGNSGVGMRMFCWQVVYWVEGERKTKKFYVHLYDDPAQAEREAEAFAEKHRI